MAHTTSQSIEERARRAWRCAAQQHWVITTEQLLAFGFSHDAIKHRVASGRLHPVGRGVYAVGRRALGRKGRWMSAVLACGHGRVASRVDERPRGAEGIAAAFLSHGSAAALLGIGAELPGRIEVSVLGDCGRRRAGIRVHRRSALRGEDVGSTSGYR